MQKYISQSDGIKACQDKIAEESTMLDALRCHHQGSTATATECAEAPNPKPVRTVASPDWAGDVLFTGGCGHL